jgi:hydroxyacylglutathione hydrolase
MSQLTVTAVPAFDDNYLWLVHAPADPRQVLVVDPGDAAAVEMALRAQDLVLAGILVTHHHGDHVGGVKALVAARGAEARGGSDDTSCGRELAPDERIASKLAPTIPVFGPGNEDIDGITHPVKGGDRVELPALGLSFAVLDVPGHTRGHIAYAGHGTVFCGDTLFSGGCGRLFEGTPAQMHASLGALAVLPPETQVYCAHEYTASNLRFALAVEPGNAALMAYAGEVAALRAAGQRTVPTTVARELAINPFLRTAVPEVRAAAATYAGQAGLSLGGSSGPNAGAIATLAALREWKNGFRG